MLINKLCQLLFLEPIALTPRIITTPIVDNFAYDTFEYRKVDDGGRGIFNWNLHFRRFPRRPQDKVILDAPITNPVMVGFVTELTVKGSEEFKIWFDIPYSTTVNSIFNSSQKGFSWKFVRRLDLLLPSTVRIFGISARTMMGWRFGRASSWSFRSKLICAGAEWWRFAHIHFHSINVTEKLRIRFLALASPTHIATRTLTVDSAMMDKIIW